MTTNSAVSLTFLIGLTILAPLGAAEPTPFYRTLPPLKVLYLAEGSTQEMIAERFRARIPAHVTFVQVFYDFLIVKHLGDDPGGTKPEMIEAVHKAGQARLNEVLDHLGDYDVIVTQFPGSSPDAAANAILLDIEQRIAQRVRAGGKLVIIDFPQSSFVNTPLAGIMPCKPTATAVWTTTGGAGATDHPFSRGLPFEISGAAAYGALYEAVDAASIPLTRHPQNRLWVRAVPGGGQVVYLYSIYGQTPSWAAGNCYQTYAPDRPDEGAVWDAFLPRLFYGLVYGDRAFPVLARIDLAAGTTAHAGEKLTVAVDVENRSGAGFRGSVELEIADRRTPAKITAARDLSLAPGDRKTVAFTNPIDLPCADNYLQIRARIVEATGKASLSESTAWVPYVHAVPLTVATAKPSYRPGDAIETVVNHGTNGLPAGAALHLYLVDHEGRVLQSSEGAKPLAMPDGGPKLLSSFWVTAVVSSPTRLLGTARAQVQSDQPWNMREQLQWSVWTNTGDPRAVALWRDAGINAVGFLGNTPAADRFAMHQYVEGLDINTFGVTIDHDNWRDVRTAMEQTLAGVDKSVGPDSRSKSLVSLGEESGFKNGWGQRYYWETDQAPPVPQKVFDDYLANLYAGEIAALNSEWGTSYQSFAGIALEKDKVRSPEGVFVNAQGWTAAAPADKSKETIPVNVNKIDRQQKYLAKSARYYETYSFFDWYYQQYCDLAVATARRLRSPVPLSMMSAPTIYAKTDVPDLNGLGPDLPKEYSLSLNEVTRRDYGDVPGFTLAFASDLHPAWSAGVLSSLLVGNSHLDYWVDFPLTFNCDLTHTRAAFWTKALLRQLHPVEPILLHRRAAHTPGLGMFEPKQPLPTGLLGDYTGGGVRLSTGVYSALEESGYLPKVVGTADLADIKVLVASYAQAVSPTEGKQLAEFVKKGGLLIVTPWLASCSPHGNLLSVYPATETGLADLLGFKLVNTSQGHAGASTNVTYNGLTLVNKGRDQVIDIAADVVVDGTYSDGTPLVLNRHVGSGQVVYLNLIHDFTSWWSLYEPQREAYRQVIDGFIRADGRIKPDYFVAYQSAEYVEDSKGGGLMPLTELPKAGAATPWWATVLYTDPSGQTKYLGIFSDNRGPKVTAEVQWPHPKDVIFDLFTGQKVASKAGRVMLTLRPGEAALWAITPTPPKTVRLASPARIVAGQPLEIKITSPHAASVVLDVFNPAGHLSRSHSLANVQLTAGQGSVHIPTAANDPLGDYRIVAIESITRARTERQFTLLPAIATDACPDREVLTPFPRRTSDEWPTATMSAEEFVTNLRLLRAIYLGSFQGLEAKYMLSYFLDVTFRENNRHAIMRRLQRVDWTPHLNAVADALRAGEKFYLVGEDLNLDPISGLTIDPFAVGDPTAFLDRLAKLPGAKRQSKLVAGINLDVITLGQGALVVSRESSVDRTAYHSSDFLTWHTKLKTVLADWK